MKKDIFIDNNIAKDFASPPDEEYKQLIRWLLEYDEEQEENNAYLVVSNGLIQEYMRSARAARSATSITAIVAKLTREGRLQKITNQQIKAFQQKHFTKKVQKKLICNCEDRNLMPVVFLSERKYVLTIDVKFANDLINFPKFGKLVVVADHPGKLDYTKDIITDENEEL